MVDARDRRAFGFARAERIAQDRQEEKYMLPLNCKDGPAPYYLPGQCPLDAIEDVARGRGEGMIMFWPMKHIIEAGQQEWSLDGDLRLWRKARAYAVQLEGQGLLVSSQDHWAVKYVRA